MAFVNGTQRAEFAKREHCFSCMGVEVENVTLLSTEAMGEAPFMITLDGRKASKPLVSVDMSNDKEFGARFPLGSAAVKKCS